MKQSERIVIIARKVVNKLDLFFYIKYTNEYVKLNKEKLSEREVIRCIMTEADDDTEQNYLFINKVLNQIKLTILIR
jgi:hypothetical protein